MTIAIEPGVQPITGHLSVERGQEREFSGMLELISLLESARSEADAAAEGSPA